MLTDILSSQTSLFSDGMQTVLRGQENRRRMAMLVNGNLTTNVRSESRGISALVRKNGALGFSSIATYTPEGARKVIQEATENAVFLAGHVQRNSPQPKAQAKKVISSAPSIRDAQQSKILEAVRAVDQYVVQKCPNVVSRRIFYTEDSMEKILVTSDASGGHIASPRAHLYVILDAMTPGGAPVEVFKAFGGYGCFEDHFTDVAWIFPLVDKLYGQLMEKREGVYAQAGLKTVILGGSMGGMLAHEAVGHTVEADLVLGGSVAGPNLNKPVASELVNLTDFASEAFGQPSALPVYLDDEGTPAKDAVLIENGILKGYMTNRETAERFGMEPTGNARAWSFSDEPIIRMRNTYLLPGKSKLEDMIASIDDGYYLIESQNGQADLTGEFMFGVSMGYEIKHGRLGRALLDTTVSGVAFDLLKTVDMVSDHMTIVSSGTCGKKQPMATSLGGPDIRCRIKIGGR